MSWSTVYLLFLIAMFFECFREAFFGGWDSHHYTRMVKFHVPEVWWTARKTTREKLEHRKRFHIDLLGRTRIRRLKK